jgi:hydroxymethylglutaryl-CoA lyase
VTVAVAFGCPYEGYVPPRRVSDVVETVIVSSPDEIALADTIGCGVPSDVQQRFESAASLTDAPLRAHFHDTRRTALANVYAAMQAGVRIFDSSTAGIGGCPFAPGAAGNVATEDLAWMLHTSDVATTIDIEAILRVGDSITEQLGIASRSAIARSGIFPSSSERVA